jgi:superfamily II DNA or RNA helicase
VKLRRYQIDAIQAIAKSWADGCKPLIEMATGTGKTIVFAHACLNALARNLRVMIVAHRSELIEQAAHKIHLITGIEPAIEKADAWAMEESLMGKARIIVASVQTLNSGDENRKRMHRFNPNEFGLLVFDEAHHSTADTWLLVARHFLSNAECRLLGVTATPDRNDDRNLGLLYDEIAYRYGIREAIDDGNLVPLRPRSVILSGINFSEVRTKKTADGGRDFVESELSAVMALEEPVHQVASATLELVYGLPRGALRELVTVGGDVERSWKLREMLVGKRHRRTLVFCVSVLHATLMADVLNRWLGDTGRSLAQSVDGETAPDERRNRIAAFRDGSCPFLCNCMIASEGFDVPSVEVIVVARPTQSRALYCQFIGRGTRPLTEIADALSEKTLTSADRRAMIAQSAKPFAEILDFTDNSQQHSLVSSIDLIAPPDADPLLVERAKEIAADQDVDASEALVLAAEDVEATRIATQYEREQAQAELDAEDERAMAPWRRMLVGAATYEVQEGTAGGGTHVAAPQGGASEKQIAFLVRLGVRRETAMGYGRSQASAVIESILEKRKGGRA